jgi:hypothetical protein
MRRRLSGKVLLTLLGTLVFGCDRSETLVLQKAPAFLYSTAEFCQWTARVGPDEPFFRPPKGILQEIPVGAVLTTLGTDIGKDTACYKVKYGGKLGYVVGSCGRVDTVGHRCPIISR